jgi:hypothetical protein
MFNKKKTLENIKGAIKKEKSRETGNIGYARRGEDPCKLL